MGRVFKPVDEMDISEASEEKYTGPQVTAPTMTGNFLRIFVWLMEMRLLGDIMMYFLKKANSINELFTHGIYNEPPMYYPKYPSEGKEEQEVILIDMGASPTERIVRGLNCLPMNTPNFLETDQPFFYRWSIRDFAAAYSSGNTTPTMVAKRFLMAVEDSEKSNLKMSIFINYDPSDILRQAAESTCRYAKGEPLSILDGVPIAVKDEIDCLPYPTTGGSKWLHSIRKATVDAQCVKQLRECGAMLVGKTNMHEFGMGTSGINPHYGAARNPYNIERISGGSSSGSAVAVSSGLCPVALGVDGGGSVRMPAALCGIIGLKPTFGSISHDGVLPLNWTVGMVGVLAATVEDALIVYKAIYRHLTSDPYTPLPKNISIPILGKYDIVGTIKLAKYTKWFDDCDGAISTVCNNALQLITENFGCKIFETTLPEIEEMRLAHYVTIACECNSSMGPDLENYILSSGWDTRFGSRVYRSFSSKEFLNAQRMRFRQMQYHMEIFKKADIIVMPTTGITAYPIQTGAIQYGELDYKNGAELVKYQVAGNLLGLPAISIPVGYDKLGLPIGLQFVGRPWSEATLLRLSHATEAVLWRSYKKPKVFYDLLH